MKITVCGRRIPMNKNLGDMAYEIKDLSFAYIDSCVNALTDINLNIPSGSFVVLCGPSGCGKTTLLRHLKPVMFPRGKREGVILYSGTDIMSVEDRVQAQDIGYVFQNPDAGIATQKVWTELAFGLESLGLDNQVIRQRVADTASYFGMQDIFEKNNDELSGGEKQLVNLASVLVMNPSVLVLDEPVSQLDPISSARFIELLGRINRENGITVVISAHRIEELLSISTHMVVMKEGKITNCYDKNKYSAMVSECKEELKEALPAATKMYIAMKNNGVVNRIDAKEDTEEFCPFSVAEGRTWLRSKDMKGIVNSLESFSKDTESERENNPVIEVKSLYYSYPKSEHGIIKNAELSIMKGEVYGMLGANGSGKSTFLSLLSGIIRPTHGKVIISKGNRLCLLPQNPELLFEKDKVKDDIDLTKKTTDNAKAWDNLREQVISLCDIEKLLNLNPYNLSGGEKQRVALAKVIMSDADILLLDEPSKGMDAAHKSTLIRIIKWLSGIGKTILIVSHDIDFVADCAERVGLLFDGNITASGAVRKFMLNNNYYTTDVVKMTRGIADGCVTVADVTCETSGNKTSDVSSNITSDALSNTTSEAPSNITSDTSSNKTSEAPSNITNNTSSNTTSEAPSNITNDTSSNTTSDALGDTTSEAPSNITNNTSSNTVKFWLIYALIMPVTIWFGMEILQDRKYYFIALLIILESMIPFYAGFEKKRYSARVIVVTAVLCATAVSSRVAFYMLPGIKPMAAIIIISGVVLGKELGFMAGSLAMLISNIFFGQGAWTPWQMFAMGLVGMIAGLLFHKRRFQVNKYILAGTGALLVFILYGGIVNLNTLLTVRDAISVEAIATTYLAGLPFDILHSIVTAALLLAISKGMIKKIGRIV
ncbi:MAG: ATP-binding cassette domain-containing protein [Lachnospiraceae bacterium]|nr:ATP-binding cassette domain-containing protein [Lachnospiraceae bacterium]